MMQDAKADMFKVLGVDNRIKIIELLKKDGPMGVNQLADTLGITPSAVSQHLKILKQAGFVRSERQGYWIPYQVDPDALEHCGQVLASVCTCGCSGCSGTGARKLERPGDRLKVLRKQQAELERQLREVKALISELE